MQRSLPQFIHRIIEKSQILPLTILFVFVANTASALEITCPKDKWIYYDQVHYLNHEKPHVYGYGYKIHGPWVEKHIHCQEGHIKVTWKIIDSYGKAHYCYQTVYVKPSSSHYGGLTVDCPPDKWISCGDLHYLKYEKPTVHASYGHHYQIKGPWVSKHLDKCGKGKIHVTWKIVEECGKIHECHTFIWVKGNDSYGHYGPVKSWPKNYWTDECSGSLKPEHLPKWYDKPILYDHSHGCSSLGVSYKDEIFYPWGDADFCYKILRTWTVIDWCNYDSYGHYGSGSYGSYGSYGNAKGKWVHEQTIKVKGGGPSPIVTCPSDVTVEVSGNEKVAYVKLDDATAVAQNSCSKKVNISHDSKYADHQGEDASGLYPIGVHWVTFWAKDGCGNADECKVKVTVVDKIPPTPYCIHGIATTIAWHNDGVYTILDPKMFDAGSYDNCTPKEKLKFEIWPNRLTCENLDTNTVYIKVIDEFGNSATCTTYVILQDHMGMCPKDSTQGIYAVTGNISTEEGMPVAEALVTFSGEETVSTITQPDGSYNSGLLRPGLEYQIIPQKDIKPLDGINSLDYVLLFQYVTGNAKLSSPYKIIAADLDMNNQVDMHDVFLLGSMIINQEDKMPAGMHSWRFVDYHQEFSDPENPFADPITETYMINKLGDHMNSMDFIGVKLGDLNGTIASGTLELRNNEGRDLNLEVNWTPYGDQWKGEISAQDLNSFDGLQAVIASVSDIPLEILSKGENVLTNSRGHQLDILAGLDGQKNQQLLMTVLSASPDQLKVVDGIAVNHDQTKGKVKIINSDKGEDLQVAPNPFVDKTTIRHRSLDAGEGTVSIFDHTGKQIWLDQIQINVGWNEYTVEARKLGSEGIYFYTLRTNDKVLSGKMLKLR